MNENNKSDMEKTNRKCCLNCQNRTVDSDGHRGCLLNPDMRVNGRMVCEEWRSDDLKADECNYGQEERKNRMDDLQDHEGSPAVYI